MSFNPVKIGSGGFVTGLLQSDKLYARTDNGGAYELNGNTWTMIYPGNIESIAKTSDGTFYIAEGAYRTRNGITNNGDLYKIVNGVKQSVLQIPMGANEEFRWIGERIQIDPVNEEVIYFCSRQNGLQISINGGINWTQVLDIPIGLSNSLGVPGITFIHCSGCPVEIDGVMRSSTIYIGVAGVGIFESLNGGQSWTQILNQVTVPQTAVLINNLLYVSFHKLSGSASLAVYNTITNTWTTIYAPGNFNALTALPDNRLLALSYPSSPYEMLIIDGLSFTKVTNPTVTSKPGWWPDWMFWTLSGVLKPFGNHIYLSTGIGVIRTSNTGNFTQWEAVADGIEQMVSFDAEVTSADKLVTAMADFNGFYHNDPSVFPLRSHYPQEFTTTTSIDVCQNNQSQLVISSSNHHEPWRMYSGYSTDGGQTFTKFSSILNNTHPNELNFGNIAIACNDPNNIVWLPTNWVNPYYTLNKGQTWIKCNTPFDDVDGGLHTHMWNTQQALCADKALDKTFYIYHHYGVLFKTSNGGVTWDSYNSAPGGTWQGAIIKTVPGQAGVIWLSLQNDGISVSADGGQTFNQLTTVQSSLAIAFGLGITVPRVYMIGKANGDSNIGLYSSLDMGLTWTLFSVLPEYLQGVTCLTASPTVLGKVYFGTDGLSFYSALVP